MLANAKGFKVLIVSSDIFVTDFLLGLVKAHGYETEVVVNVPESTGQLPHIFGDVVFIDDSCLGMENFKNVSWRMENLFQMGVPIILLANEQTVQFFEQNPMMKFFRIVRKPAGYLQVGQVMADLLTV